MHVKQNITFKLDKVRERERQGEHAIQTITRGKRRAERGGIEEKGRRMAKRRRRRGE